ncbi:MAG TPA: hypothetical protein VHC20_04015 [Candidatus Paceibacterota bacterium]|nr:hypothetical protein [Candidatus Paceibacterota bacterium]
MPSSPSFAPADLAWSDTFTSHARAGNDAACLPVTLAERYFPRVFEQIATTAAINAKGRCEDLVTLERIIDQKPVELTSTIGKLTTADEAESGADGESNQSVVLSEWLASPAIRTWARIKPELGGVDLRPYLFVTKDRKDYFGAASILGHLHAVVEQLLGPKLSVQALDGDLRRLALPEANTVFEALRGRILTSATFDTEPAGAAGLAALVKAHPQLQGNLVAFLEGLPSEKLGPWPVRGWEGVITEPDTSARFERLLDTWAKSAKSQFLRSAAAAALKTRRGGR